MAVERPSWSNAVLLRQNTDRLLRELRDKLGRYEARYEMASGRVEGELTAGRLRETTEICDWLMAFRTYRMLTEAQHRRPAPERRGSDAPE